MRLKSIIAILVSFMLLLAACSPSGGESSSVPAESTASSGTSSVAADSSEPAPAAEGPMKLVWMGGNGGAPLEDGSWGEVTFNERFNVEVEIVRAEDDAARNVLFASGLVPDYISVSNMIQLTDYVNQGIMGEIPMEMIEKNMPGYYAMCREFDPNFFVYSIIDGANMGVPKMTATAAPIPAAIRADWLKNVGITKVPSTLEELEAAFVAFTEQDPDGDGQNDTYALSAAGGEPSRAINRRLFPSIFGIFGVNPFWWTEDGNGGYTYGFASQGYKEALLLLNKWYTMGLIDPEFATLELRTSGEDVVFKFASGITGYLDGSPFDDYEFDNDGHVNSKWVANNPSWQEYFETNKDAPDLYKYNNTPDFDDSYIDPYYINLPPIAGPDGTVHGYMRESLIGGYLGVGYQTDDAKKEKILQILEAEAMNEEDYVLHYGPEGPQWVFDTDGTTRIYNPEWANDPSYHPQGRIQGSGFFLFPMYYANPDLLNAVGGPRYAQRYDLALPMFRGFTNFMDPLAQASLPAAVDNPDLVQTDVITYTIRAIRGDLDINATYDQTISDWLSRGGQELIDEANAYWDALQ